LQRERENNQNEIVNENEDREEEGGNEVNHGELRAVGVQVQAQVQVAGGGEVGAAGGLGFVIGGGLGAAHQALLLRDGPTGFLPYTRPKIFPVKVCTNPMHVYNTY